MKPAQVEKYLKREYKKVYGEPMPAGWIQKPMNPGDRRTPMKWQVAQRSPVRPLRFKKPTPMKIKELTPKLKQD
jgi:hypothetical protein